ncbi:MAG TPA: PQQ-dependent catabolism-associated CXXCW motif protein [Acetobacteraceae bacterium]
MILARRALLLAAFAWPARADSSVPEPDGFRMDDYRAPVPDTVRGGTVLHTEALRALIARAPPVLIDVLPAPRRPPAMRPEAPWLPPRHHAIPGSLWWPDVGRGALSPELETRFRARLAEVTAGDAARLVVFYCLADCWMSWNATRRAAAWGVRAAWYPEGADGWKAAGLPLAELAPEALD